MAENNSKIDYDTENDILYLAKASKSIKESIDIGDFIIDISHDDFVVGIEILNASLHLNLSPKNLTNLHKASMKVIYKSASVYITLLLQFPNQHKDITIPLTIDLGHDDILTSETNFALT